jgi:predicted GH43/DUF377 family glycosyl hydrolase
MGNKMQWVRCKENPIVTPGGFEWRKVAVFNPGVILVNGKFHMYERAAGSLRPFKTCIGLLESGDGIHFTHVKSEPVFTGDMAGYPDGSVQDARVVEIDGAYYMTYAIQPHLMDCYPDGRGVPEYRTDRYPGWKERREPMMTQSGIAVSGDAVRFRHLGFNTPEDIDDRDNVLFPEKIGGRFAMLRRPAAGARERYGIEEYAICISYSDDLLEWTDPKAVAKGRSAWEGGKIGAAGPPIRTDRGWLLLYHGVDAGAVYRVGAMMLDPENPERVIARTRNFIMEPETYYEKHGLVIPNVVFPTGGVVRDGMLYMYYGCADTAIGLATAPLDLMVGHVFSDS